MEFTTGMHAWSFGFYRPWELGFMCSVVVAAQCTGSASTVIGERAFGALAQECLHVSGHALVEPRRAHDAMRQGTLTSE